MRLIDADALIDEIRNSDDVEIEVIEAFVDLQPTAFDVEMCIEALEGCEHVIVNGDIMISMNDAINVVKDGGIYD